MNTRRNFVRGLSGLGAIVATGHAPTIVKSMIAARGTMLGGKKAPTAKSYVQDGLVAMWDGIENAGWGVHDESATLWRNLAQDSLHMPLTQAASWGQDYAYCNGNSWLGRIDEVISPENSQTVEVGAAWQVRTGYAHYGLQCLFFSGTSPTDSRIIINEGSDKLAFLSRQTGQDMIGNLTINEDNPICASVVYDTTYGVALRLYKDGNVANTVWSTCNRSVGTGTVIGGLGSTSLSIKGYTKGKFFFVRVYSRALTADEIAANCAVDKKRFNIT